MAIFKSSEKTVYRNYQDVNSAHPPICFLSIEQVHVFYVENRLSLSGFFSRERSFIFNLNVNIEGTALEEEFSFLFEKLNIKDTKILVDKYVKPIKAEKKKEDFL